MIDAVLSYHLNPNTCGVARFNQQLAGRLGVPLLSFDKHPVAHPLVSVKGSEFGFDRPDWPLIVLWYRRYDLFLHDNPHGLCLNECVRNARRVYAGNQSIAAHLRHVREDIIEAFCPSTIAGNQSRGAYRVLVFGMAHKLLLPHFESLKQQLDIEHPDYTVELSTAVHEGSPWDEALTESVDAMRGIFGDKLRVLGFLGDDALAKELREVDAVAAYYTPALRANNTSAWAALEAGKKLYTNTDADSPPLDASLHSWEMLTALIKGAA